MPNNNQELLESVIKSPKYKEIIPSLIERVIQNESIKNRNRSEIIKATKTVLHQIGGAYLNSKINYSKFLEQLQLLPPKINDERVQLKLKQLMQLHASSKERLPILDTFFQKIFSDLPPINSVLDLACGFNPLAIPWMPLEDNFSYLACDIYKDMINFHNNLFSHFGINGKAYGCDLSAIENLPQVQLTLILKTFPCLEQLNKQISLPLLNSIDAEFVIVSFPMKSLSGREKGMRETYSRHFEELLSWTSWKFRSYFFSSELAFLLYH